MKVILTAFCLACLLFFSACEGKKEKDKSPEGSDTTGTKTGKVPPVNVEDTICDYYVNEAETIEMIKKYESDFHKSGLKKEVWIKKCVWVALKNFMDSNPGYDGVRFFWAVDKKWIGKSTFLSIVATTPATSGIQYERHTNHFGVDIPLNGCDAGDLRMNLPVSDALEFVNKFGKDYRKETTEGQRNSALIKPLSISLWMDKCKIRAIHSAVTSSENFDGLMALAASYYKDDVRRERGDREFAVQTTLIFVPTVKGRLDYSFFKDMVRPADNGFNHGQLCPRQCD